jgi:aconitate hydratase
MIIPPHDDPGSIEVIRGPNIKPIPKAQPLAAELKGEILIKVGDNISTDAIMPAGPKILPLRSNIPAISEYVFTHIDPGFAKRAKEKQGGFIVGGDNYGQGSSREHAALAPLYLGIKAVIARSFARIHKANLLNFGILPLELMDAAGFDSIRQGEILECKGIRELIQKGSDLIPVNIGSATFNCGLDISSRQREIILAGGLLKFTKLKHS